MKIEEPRVGQVIKYSYLWFEESVSGQTEGKKDRPSVIVVATKPMAGNKSRVKVMPITHTMPKNPAIAIEIPLKVKQHLGLDAERSWIIVNEVNEFTWPGFDLRGISGKNSAVYGMIPPKLFNLVIDRLATLATADSLNYSNRDL